jgi:hypothetical protein
VIYREVVLNTLVDYLRTRGTASREDTTAYFQKTLKADQDAVDYAWACLVLTNFVDFHKPVDMWALNDFGHTAIKEHIACAVTLITKKYLSTHLLSFPNS